MMHSIRRWVVLVIGVVVAVVAVTMLVDKPASTVSVNKPTKPSSVKPETASKFTSNENAKPETVQVPSMDAQKVSIETVEAARARLRSISASITDEQLREEGGKMQQTLEKMRQFDLVPPKEELVRDDRGFAWTKLTYPSGQILYKLPPGPDKTVQ